MWTFQVALAGGLVAKINQFLRKRSFEERVYWLDSGHLLQGDVPVCYSDPQPNLKNLFCQDLKGRDVEIVNCHIYSCEDDTHSLRQPLDNCVLRQQKQQWSGFEGHSLSEGAGTRANEIGRCCAPSAKLGFRRICVKGSIGMPRNI